MIAKTPVIATGIDAVQHEQTGLLVDQRAPEQIARMVEWITIDADIRVKIQDNAFRQAHHRFSRASSAQAFSAVFDQFIGQCQG
ncbi:MAG: glycosyltransferase [Thiohalocapsa sp. PB-PSB1]|nr:MAG: hypothetical protein N838_18580 [Thiohalocapsa sp. PB-PSB1]QQO57391.1 MAG: glycosyltransferase [Thiohalocapsa sp. PB-PSB1]